MQIVTIKLIKKVIKPIIELFVVFGISYRSLDMMIKEIYVSISSKNLAREVELQITQESRWRQEFLEEK